MKIRLDYLLMWIVFGARWREKLWVTRGDKESLENQILISTTPILLDRWGLSSVKVEIQSEFPCINPSIVKSATGYTVVIRSSNLLNLNDGNYFYKSPPHRTINYILELDKQFQIISQAALNDSAVTFKGTAAEMGIEDIRLFKWRDTVWACGAGLHKLGSETQIGIQQILCRLDNNCLLDPLVFDSPYGNKVEKNWMPLVHANSLNFAYGLSPLEIFQVVDGKLNNGKFSKGNLPRKNAGDYQLRGGTPFVRWKNVYLGVAHSAYIHRHGKRYYVHHFVVLNNELQIQEVSEPFFIQRKGTEFASGLELDEESVILAYGVADRGCRIVRIPDSIVEKYITL